MSFICRSFASTETSGTLLVGHIEMELLGAGARRPLHALPNPSFPVAWEALGLEPDWKGPEKDQCQVGLPTRED